jgi:hypothetical protein
MLHEERKAFFKKKPLASLVYDKGALEVVLPQNIYFPCKLLKRLPCAKGGGTACRDGRIVYGAMEGKRKFLLLNLF